MFCKDLIKSSYIRPQMMGLTAEDNLANTAENNFEIKYCKSKVHFEGKWNL